MSLLLLDRWQDKVEGSSPLLLEFLAVVALVYGFFFEGLWMSEGQVGILDIRRLQFARGGVPMGIGDMRKAGSSNTTNLYYYPQVLNSVKAFIGTFHVPLWSLPFEGIECRSL